MIKQNSNKSKGDLASTIAKVNELSNNLNKSNSTWLFVRQIDKYIEMAFEGMDAHDLKFNTSICDLVVSISMIRLSYFINGKPVYSKELKATLSKVVDKLNDALGRSKSNLKLLSLKEAKEDKPKGKSKTATFKKESLRSNSFINKIGEIKEAVEVCFYTQCIQLSRKLFNKLFYETYFMIKQIFELAKEINLAVISALSVEIQIGNEEHLNSIMLKVQRIREFYYDCILLCFDPELHKKSFGCQLSLFELLPKPPFLNIKNPNDKRMTLVLDLDETLVHSFKGCDHIAFFSRPCLLEFLTQLHPYYEIGIFTSSAQDYADSVLNKIGDHFFEFRLYRQHTNQDGKKCKDLSKLGRNLSKLIFVDNHPLNFDLQPENSLYIKTWEYSIHDSQLQGLASFLKLLSNSNPTDVRQVISVLKSTLLTKEFIDSSINPYASVSKETLKLILDSTCIDETMSAGFSDLKLKNEHS